MLTPQEVEERVFPKAKKGGYDMQDVDNFLDQLTADYTELFKENAALKRKMKVLADKITEYQETEGAMRATLLAAQKMGNEIVEEAKKKQASILEETESVARKRTEELKQEIADLESRSKSMKSSVSAMTASIRDLLAHEQEFLEGLPTMEVEGEQKGGLPTGEERENIIRTMDEQRDALNAEKASDEAPAEEAEPVAEAEAPAEEETAPAEAEEEAPAEETEDESTETADEFPTRRLDLSELRFGRNYEIK